MHKGIVRQSGFVTSTIVRNLFRLNYVVYNMGSHVQNENDIK